MNGGSVRRIQKNRRLKLESRASGPTGVQSAKRLKREYGGIVGVQGGRIARAIETPVSELSACRQQRAFEYKNRQSDETGLLISLRPSCRSVESANPRVIETPTRKSHEHCRLLEWNRPKNRQAVGNKLPRSPTSTPAGWNRPKSPRAIETFS